MIVHMYHIFKQIILLFGFIMLFDIAMFLLSLTQTTLVESTRLNSRDHSLNPAAAQ